MKIVDQHAERKWPKGKNAASLTTARTMRKGYR